MNPEILRLENVTLMDEGWYSCIVGNSVGRAEASVYLEVLNEERKLFFLTMSSYIINQEQRSWRWVMGLTLLSVCVSKL